MNQTPTVGHTLLVVLLGFSLILVPIPLVLLVLLPSLLLRAIVSAIARVIRPDLAGILSVKGALFALESVHTKPKVSILLNYIFDGSFPLDVIRAQYQRVIIEDVDKSGNLRYPQLRQHWTQFLGFLFWKWDREFHINNHIRPIEELQLRLPSPCTEDDLKNVTSNLLARPYPAGRSPWEVFIVPNYRSSDNKDGREQTAIVFRIHHALGDGYSILRMCLRFLGHEDAKIPRPSLRKEQNFRQQVTRALVMPFRLPFDVARVLLDSIDGPNAWHLMDAKLERKYHTFFSDPMEVDDIKRIKNKFGVGYNAAVYAVAAGGIRRLMQEAGQKVPKRMSIFVPLPLPNQPKGLAVNVSGFFFKFSPVIKGPGERLLEISKNMEFLGTAPAVPLVLGWATHLMGAMPIWGMRMVANKLMMTITMTSFPAPELKLEFMGNRGFESAQSDEPRKRPRLVDIIPALGHMPGKLGATAVLISVGGKQRIGLTVDRKIFANHPVPQNFAHLVYEEVCALLNCPRKDSDIV